MELKGRKIVVLVEQLYEDLEFWYPVLRFREAGATVTVAGPQPGDYPSKHGYIATADVAAEEVNLQELDAVIIPGGYAPDHMRRTPPMIELVRKAANEGKVVAAICHAGWMLASADVIRGKKVTGYYSIKDDLVHAGAEYLDQEVVRDGNLITSRFPPDLPAFCRAIIEAVK